MGDIVTSIFSTFTQVISSLSSGIKSAFEAIIYEDASVATPVLSGIAKFGFTMLGIALATGLVYAAVRLIKR